MKPPRYRVLDRDSGAQVAVARWLWLARLRARFYVDLFPYRAADIVCDPPPLPPGAHPYR